MRRKNIQEPEITLDEIEKYFGILLVTTLFKPMSVDERKFRQNMKQSINVQLSETEIVETMDIGETILVDKRDQNIIRGFY